MPNESFFAFEKVFKKDKDWDWIKSLNTVQRKSHIPPLSKAKGANLKTFEYSDKVYEVDEDDFLMNPDEWDKDFAEGMALEPESPETSLQSTGRYCGSFAHFF